MAKKSKNKNPQPTPATQDQGQVKDATATQSQGPAKAEAATAPTEAKAPPPMEVLVGLANRKNYALTVVLKKDSFVLSAAAKTGKDYKISDIVTVQNMPLQKAVSSGLCAVIR